MTNQTQIPLLGQEDHVKAGDLLRKIRKNKGFTNLASFCDLYEQMFEERLPTATLSQYEIGLMKPSKRRFERFCVVLEVEEGSELAIKLKVLWGGNLREVKIHEPHIFSPQNETIEEKSKLATFDPNEFPELVRYMNAVVEKQQNSGNSLCSQDKILLFVLSVR